MSILNSLPELERVEAACASAGVEDVAADAGHHAGAARLEVGHGVQVTLAGSVLACRLEVDDLLT